MAYKGFSTNEDIINEKLQKELNDVKFPKRFDVKISMNKVNLDIIMKWVDTRINELIPGGDEILVQFIENLLTTTQDPKKIYLQIKSFLEEDALKFVKQLWDLLISAQDDPDGIPSELLEMRKKEILQAQIEEEERSRIQRRQIRERPRTYNRNNRTRRDHWYSKNPQRPEKHERPEKRERFPPHQSDRDHRYHYSRPLSRSRSPSRSRSRSRSP
ncbi:hypothetical protein PACTADRAFT_50016 [Pachysolen tannophilus NRRL Y-2460]|uniref:U1 small nuclear ribonucleoprotein component SNU71 n=1 Tax=Pachysolen tannophilus NRRL Y-2460 TaxID=669874 RepID=A0A1E4TU51_PACTA|nr:hypothetical protein PACTADRAFT_50016 [Pachysolen tannophilus NRRL Y-2460]